jgi:hypothetical protein
VRPHPSCHVRGGGDLAARPAVLTIAGAEDPMAKLYEDRHVTCDADGLTIHRYYFPFGGDKRISYAEIRRADDREMGPLTGQWRIWGMGLPPYWFHLDGSRPSKTRCIALDVGATICPAVTPDNVDAVLAILKERAPK